MLSRHPLPLLFRDGISCNNLRLAKLLIYSDIHTNTSVILRIYSGCQQPLKITEVLYSKAVHVRFISQLLKIRCAKIESQIRQLFGIR